MASTRLASEVEAAAPTDPKRPKPEEGGLIPVPGLSGTSSTDPFNCPPSKVVHIRGLPEFAQSSDLTAAISVFGTISYVVMMKNNRQALVEMQDVPQAVALVRASAQTPVYVGGQRIFINFSKSQEIARDMGPAGANGMEVAATNILLLTVLNPLYPITTEVLNTICSPFGKVLRIVIFRKHGVQGMVELESVEVAKAARDALNNADVYAGCCTLKIEYSRAQRLNVYKNDEETWDYTQPNLGAGRGSEAKLSTIGRDNANFAMGVMGVSPAANQLAMSNYMTMTQPMAMGAGIMGGAGGPVLMVYGLDSTRMNCDRLFNLFCMYGNVAKIKFLPEKPGIAMVQMSDGYAADVARQSLHEAPMFGSKLEISPSKHPYIAGNQQIKTLADGTQATAEYGASKLNRFLRPDNKNRLYRPSELLHFFNAPPGSTPESITEILSATGITLPISVKVFDKDTTRPSTGMLEFDTVEHGVEAAALVNHMKMATATGPESIVFKVAFSMPKRT